MDKLLDFSQQTAIITGAASGFGRLLAIELNQRGCKVALSDINLAGLKDTQSSLEFPEASFIFEHDVTKEQESRILVEKTIEQFGSLTHAINNAGVAHTQSPLHELTENIYNTQFDVNVKGVAFGIKYQVLEMLKRGGGHVINIASLAGISGAPKGGAYSAAKHAVVGLTRTAAIEYGRYNVRTNAICPFFSPTNIMNIDGLSTEEEKQKLGLGSPMKRISTVEEIVNVIVLLMSPYNTFMNGQAISIDGGITAW